MRSKYTFSIKWAILIGLFLGILFPIFIASIYTINTSTQKIYKEFEDYRKELTKNIASSMSNPIYNFSPTRGSLYLDIVKQDSRIVKIEVYDNITESEFILINIPKRDKSNILVNHQYIYKNNEKIGWLEISFSDYTLQKKLEETKELLVEVSVFTFFALMLLMYPLMNYKIISPLKRLLKQTEDFKHDKLHKEYTWTKDDEINSVGRSFDLARLAILKLIKQLKNKNKELEKLYITDRLTGLFNRHKLDKELKKEEDRNKRFNHLFGVIIIDIDDFKKINDTFGHLVGDKVLVQVSKILSSGIRKTDTLGRWGGEEFLLIVPETNKKELLLLSEKIRALISNHDFEDIKSVTASFGIAICKENENIQELISRADSALYVAKRSGKNRVYYK